MNNEAYHAHAAWSQSAAKLLPKRPERFYAEHIAKTIPREPTASQEFGSAVHAILSGCESVIEIPASALTTNGQRRGAAWEDFKKQNPGSLLLLPSVYDKARRAADSVMDDPAARRLLEAPGAFEESLFWTDAATGLNLKCRPDKQAIFSDETVVVDIKTTSDDPADEDDLGWTCHRYKYHFQAAWYSAGVEAVKLVNVPAFVFIFVQNEPPYVCRVYELADRAVERGAELMREALDDLADRLKRNCWHGAGRGECLYLDLPERTYR